VTVQFELWQLITLCLTLLGLFIGLGKVVLAKFERYIEVRFDTLEHESKGWRTVEGDLLRLRVELAERYVKRDDYVRGQTVIEAKLDAISSEVRNVQIQGARRES
jgi:hypothetical protein